MDQIKPAPSVDAMTFLSSCGTPRRGEGAAKPKRARRKPRRKRLTVAVLRLPRYAGLPASLESETTLRTSTALDPTLLSQISQRFADATQQTADDASAYDDAPPEEESAAEASVPAKLAVPKWTSLQESFAEGETVGTLSTRGRPVSEQGTVELELAEKRRQEKEAWDKRRQDTISWIDSKESLGSADHLTEDSITSLQKEVGALKVDDNVASLPPNNVVAWLDRSRFERQRRLTVNDKEKALLRQKRWEMRVLPKLYGARSVSKAEGAYPVKDERDLFRRSMDRALGKK